MNDTDHAMHDLGHEFDLLADGELSESQRHELLSRLDELPNGWRRCALAFLESQDWRRELPAARETSATFSEGSTDGSAHNSTDGPAVPPTIVARRPPLGWLGTTLAMAASFVLALGMGVAWRGGWWSDSGGRPHQALKANTDDVAASDLPASSGAPSDATQAATSPQYGTVQLSLVGADGQQQLVEVPVLAVDRYDPALIGRQPQGLSADLVKQLRRSGHEVRQYRELVPVSLEDGRQLVLPVDQVEVRFVNQGYQ